MCPERPGTASQRGQGMGCGLEVDEGRGAGGLQAGEEFGAEVRGVGRFGTC